MALVVGPLLAILILKLKEKSIVILWNNTLLVGWAHKLLIKSKHAARLMKILVIAIEKVKVIVLILLLTLGSENREANCTTRCIHKNDYLLTKIEFLVNFRKKFYLNRDAISLFYY